MVECKVCRYCDTRYANDGYGYCQIRLPGWITISSNSTFGADKLVCVKAHCDDGCDLGVALAPGEVAEFAPTQNGFL